MKLNFIAGLSLLLCCSFALSATDAQPICAQALQRPCTALVLGGGGARGGAHLGVLRQLEQQGVAIDLIVGTSIGAFIGGLYATGHSPDQIEQILRQLEWGSGFRDKVYRDEMPLRQKEQQDAFPIRLALGVDETGLKAPKGVLLGQAMAELILQAYGAELNHADFNQLAIPFRAVATDLTNRGAVVLAKGSLLHAVQASMSIPGVVRPMELDGRLLVDGGVANNLPVSIARGLGAERVIAVSIDAPLLNKNQLDSAFAVTDQLTNFLVRQVVEQEIASLGSDDLLIEPELGTIGTLDFGRFPESIAAGTAAAQALHQQVQRFAAAPADYQQWLVQQRAERSERVQIDRITLDNQSRMGDQLILDRLALQPGQQYRSSDLKEGLRQVYGVDTFERVSMQLVEAEDGTELKVQAQEKSWGPGYLNFSFALEDDFQANRYYQLAASYTYTNLSPLGAEWHSALALGSDKQLQTELYWPVLSARTYVSVGAVHNNNVLGVQDQGLLSLGELLNEENLLYSETGWDLSDHARLSLKWQQIRGRYEFPRFVGEQLGTHYLAYRRDGPGMEFVWDRLNNPAFPSRGWRISIAKHWLEDDVLAQRTSSQSQDFDVMAARSWQPHTLRARWHWQKYQSAEGALALEQHSLGGLLNLSGYPKNYLFGSEIRFASLVYLYRMNENRFSIVNAPFYLGTSIERGKVAGNMINLRELANQTDWIWAGSLFAGWDSPIGPIYLGYGVAEQEHGHRTQRYYLSIGQNY
ncbi:patatin-like phospholipase family protein [Rheinheimera sp.]|uniref:patatin-like phospholipase family protein n=1 Tax=Rheinheimera sp. TaxID=1869214 RepID=UPI003AF4C43C